MTGLILKDIINLKQQGKIFIAIILIWMIVAIADSDPIFFGVIMCIFALIVPLSSMSYDEKAKWNKYALTMPVSRRDIVMSKYLLSIGVSLTSALLSFFLGVFLSGDIKGMLWIAAGFFLAGLGLASLVLPITFKFGAEKGRFILIAIIMIPTVISVFWQKTGVTLPWEAIEKPLAYGFPIFVVLFTLASMGISLRVFKNKEL